MTKATREGPSGETIKEIRCFPDEKLLDTIARLMNDEEDGNVVEFKIIGKLYLPGDMERPVAKFHGRALEIRTDKLDEPITIKITDF